MNPMVKMMSAAMKQMGLDENMLAMFMSDFSLFKIRFNRLELIQEYTKDLLKLAVADKLTKKQKEKFNKYEEVISRLDGQITEFIKVRKEGKTEDNKEDKKDVR